MSEQTALAKVNQYFENDLIRSRFQEVVGNRNAGAYISSVLLAVSESDKLQACSLSSIYTSALRAATLKLSVDKSTGQAYLVPFKGKAELVVGYKGLYDMAVRTGKYRYINVFPVFEGEVVEEDRFTGWHKIAGGKQSDTIIGWMGAFELFTGFGHTLYMTVKEIHEHAARYSKNYAYDDSIWKKETRKMERKTVLRLMLRKWGYLDPADMAALDMVENGADDDLIEAPVVTKVENRARRSEEEILRELGYTPEPKPNGNGHKPPELQPEPEPLPQPGQDLAAMTVTEAMETLSPAGKSFKTISDANLNYIINHPDEFNPNHCEAAKIVLDVREQERLQA